MKIILLIILLSLFSNGLHAQSEFFTAFWNVENLFDTEDTPGRDDSEFLPGSEKKWDQEKFHKKIINLVSVIMSMNRGRGPDILGLCEVENKAVVDSLVIYLNPGYGIVHLESPDLRGIDNALIFRDDLFTLTQIFSDTINLAGETTRNILGGRFVTKSGDTFSIFVNHWPSRRGGDSSEEKRFKAADVLKTRLSGIGANNFLIIMGDFNDEPENKSLDSVLNAGKTEGEKDLYNLAYHESLAGEGSYKFRDSWNMLDQIIISDRENSGNISYIKDSFEIYKPYFMITAEGKYAGTPKPFYGGSRFLGGYSDHFPVTAKFKTGTRWKKQ